MSLSFSWLIAELCVPGLLCVVINGPLHRFNFRDFPVASQSFKDGQIVGPTGLGACLPALGR